LNIFWVWRALTQGFRLYALLTVDGALEVAPAMGCADIILDLASTGRVQQEVGFEGIDTGF
jgi:ATP phosphoribosyltransferase